MKHNPSFALLCLSQRTGCIDELEPGGVAKLKMAWYSGCGSDKQVKEEQFEIELKVCVPGVIRCS